MTKEKIEERKAQLQAEIEQAVRTIQALHGAIQDCDHWLAQLEKEHEEP